MTPAEFREKWKHTLVGFGLCGLVADTQGKLGDRVEVVMALPKTVTKMLDEMMADMRQVKWPEDKPASAVTAVRTGFNGTRT